MIFTTKLEDKIRPVRNSIVAIGFHPNPQQITIIGSGFNVSDDGKILTAAHLYNKLKEEQRQSLKAFVMVEQMQKDFERYQWLPIKLINKSDVDDLALFQLEENKNSLFAKELAHNLEEI